MRLQDIFKTPTTARLLDLLLANPAACYDQGDLKRRLNVDKATIRRTLAHLRSLGLVAVDVNPAGVGIKAITFNDETEQGMAALTFYRRITALRPESRNHEREAQSRRTRPSQASNRPPRTITIIGIHTHKFAPSTCTTEPTRSKIAPSQD